MSAASDSLGSRCPNESERHLSSLGALGQNIDLGAVGQFALAMASDPHMVLAMASLIPGLGELAAAADMALYLYEGDYQNAALAGAMLLPGGVMFVAGMGLRGAREALSIARAGAKDFRAAMEGSRIVNGLRKAGTAVKDVLSLARGKVDCSNFLRATFPSARVTHSFECGATKASRSQGVQDLRDAVRSLFGE